MKRLIIVCSIIIYLVITLSILSEENTYITYRDKAGIAPSVYTVKVIKSPPFSDFGVGSGRTLYFWHDFCYN